MLPMFLVAGAAPEWQIRAIGPVAVTGLVLLAVGLVFGLPIATWPGAALGVGAAVLFIITVAGYFQRRLVRRLEPAFGHVAIGFGCLVLALAAGVVQLVLPGMSARGWIVYAELTLLGWLVVFITGIWYRLFTFLIWLHFYGAAGSRTRTAAELVHRGTAWVALGLLAFGIALLVGGTAGASAEAARFGAGAFLAGSVLVVSEHARIFHGRASGTSPRATVEG